MLPINNVELYMSEESTGDDTGKQKSKVVEPLKRGLTKKKGKKKKKKKLNLEEVNERILTRKLTVGVVAGLDQHDSDLDYCEDL